VERHRIVVVEIGVGGQPPMTRPFARDACYVGVDVDATLLEPEVTPVAAADAARLPFPDRSVDHVVACNVFGDIGLGHGFEEVVGFDPRAYAHHVQILVAAGAIGELQELRAKVHSMVDAVEDKKLAILREAARALRGGGDVIVVETLTPQFAEEWIARIGGGGGAREATLRVGETSYRCRAVATHNRRRRYCTPAELSDPSLKVWVLTPGGRR
jgi:hypothetical protein